FPARAAEPLGEAVLPSPEHGRAITAYRKADGCEGIEREALAPRERIGGKEVSNLVGLEPIPAARLEIARAFLPWPLTPPLRHRRGPGRKSLLQGQGFWPRACGMGEGPFPCDTAIMCSAAPYRASLHLAGSSNNRGTLPER